MHEKKDGERNPNCPDCRGEVLITDGGTSTSGTDQLTIYLNGAEHTIPNTVETEADILRAVDLDPDGYLLYWDDDVRELGEEQQIRVEGDIHGMSPVVVSDGDEFVAIPRRCNDA